MNKIKKLLFGFLVGTVNVMLGAGGGIITVPYYKKIGFSQKEAQINAVATILPITIISSIIYLFNGNVNFSNALIYVIPGLLGSVAGTLLIKKLSNKFLTVVFGGFMIYAGVRMLLK